MRDGRLAPPTNREDVGVWLDTVAEFVLETDECVPAIQWLYYLLWLYLLWLYLLWLSL